MNTCPSCEQAVASFPCACGFNPYANKQGIEARSTYVLRPNGITKEQFGTVLYDVIFAISGIRGLEEQIAGAIHREQGYKLQDLKARRLALKATLAAQLPTLPESNMDDVLARYPYVVGL